MRNNSEISVSLIITTYNWEQALNLVVRSVFVQSVLPDEIIIADDGSKNPTKELISNLQKESPIPLIHSWQEDKGFRAAMSRNKAIAKASSDYIISIDGDIILHQHFIRDHKKHAEANLFTIGPRVIISEKTSSLIFEKQHQKLMYCSKGIKNRKNTIYSSLLSHCFSGITKSLKGIRTCNMGFWKDDAVKVNGFNEDFTGWGREDSEFAVRLFNTGIKRKNIRFNAIGYHLYHAENTRENLNRNDEILDKAISSKTKRCENGLDKYFG